MRKVPIADMISLVRVTPSSYHFDPHPNNASGAAPAGRRASSRRHWGTASANHVPMRLRILLITMLASQAAAQSPKPAGCLPVSADTAGWPTQGSVQFGTRFLAPPRYRRKAWEVHGSNMPGMGVTDAEDYWPITSVLWIFTFATDTSATLAIPKDAHEYSICVEPWSGKRGSIERFRAGGDVDGTKQHVCTLYCSRVLATAERSVAHL